MRRAPLHLLALVIAATTTAHAQAPPPATADVKAAEDLLAARGLKRVGRLYVLQSETDTRMKLQELQRQLTTRSGEMRNTVRAGQLAQRQYLAAQDGIAALQAERDQFTYYLNNEAQTPNAAAQARQDLQRINDQIRLANDRIANLEQNAQNFALQAANIQQKIAETQAEIQDRVAALETEYQQVAQDGDVFDALMTVNRKGRPWTTLGPEADAQRKLAQLAERALAESGLRIDPRAKMVVAAAEADFNAACHNAWVLGQKLKGLEADAARAKLANLVPTLRPMADEIAATYQDLAQNRFAQDAVAEYAAATKTRLRVGPSAEFKKNFERLSDLEALIDSRDGPGSLNE